MSAIKLSVAVTIGLWFLVMADICKALPYYPMSIPTRDNKSLAADLYAFDSSMAKPVILIQTPYNKNYYRDNSTLGQAGGALFLQDSLAYNYVVLDWRGFYMSAGAAVSGYDLGLDGYDAVEWIAQQLWCDGNVGTSGGSALGLIQFQTAKHSPPHLKCCAPMIKDYKTKYTDYYCGGVYRKEHVESLERLGFLQATAVLAHPDYDAAWRLLENASDYPDSFAVPMFLISGWYDHYPDGVLRAFGDLRARSVPAVRSLHRLLMGPWEHSFIGQADQGALSYPEAVGVPDSMLQLFFARFLKGEPNNWENDPAITYFQMGENIWRTTPSWTSLGAYPDTFYFAANQTLQHEPPTANSQPDTFTCDPRNPVPAAGGSRFSPFDNSILTGPQDLAPGIEVREDVLVFSTPVLTQEIVIDGPVVISLAVSCNRLDTDISARLCDVFPDGRSMLMQQGIRRMRFRDSYAAEELMIPGTVYNVEIILPDLALTITKGHRLRIDIAGADYPFFDLNLNNGQAMYTAGDTLTAHTVLYHDSLHPSMVIMPGPEHRSAVRFPRQALSVSHAQNSQVQIYTRNRMIYVSSQKQYSRIVIMNTQGQKVADLNTAGLSGASKASAIRVSPGAFFCTVVSPGEVLTWRVVVH